MVNIPGRSFIPFEFGKWELRLYFIIVRVLGVAVTEAS